jgi:hypothetical protein
VAAGHCSRWVAWTSTLRAWNLTWRSAWRPGTTASTPTSC